jgi:hypothetical protein
MTSIPGIGDEEEYHLESLHSDCKRPLSPDVKQENGRKKFHAAIEDDDRLLYGDDEQAVSEMTLINRRLPAKEVDFVMSVLSKQHENQEHHISETFSKVKHLPEIEATNVFEVTFVSSLWLESRKLLSRPRKFEHITFYPFFKHKVMEMLYLSCFCPVSGSHATESSGKSEKVSLLTTGQLVSVRIIPIDESIRSVDTYGYIHEHGRRMPDNSLRLEVDVRSRYEHPAGKTIMQDIVLMIPLTDENRHLLNNSKYYLTLAPITAISGLFTQIRAVYGIGLNPLFRYFLAKDFTLSPTGTLITSDAGKYSAHQLEAIQRAFDLVIQPGNPCKAVLVDGSPANVCETVIEIINQILTNDLTKGQQYIVTSSESSLIFLIKSLKKRLPNLMSSKIIFFAGHGDERITQHALKCMSHEIEQFERNSPNDQSNKKVACLKKCVSAMQSTSGLMNSDADVLMTVDSYKHHSLISYLKRAQLIFGTLKDFSRLPELYEHLKSEKVLSCAATSHPDSKSNVPLSHTVIADAETLTDPELMAFSSEEEFQFRRFILTSRWLPGDQSSQKFQHSAQQSLCDRLKRISATAESPLVVDVGHDVP